MKKMPLYVFIRREKDGDGSSFLNVYEKQADAIEDDGPTEVTTYTRTNTVKIQKTVSFVGKPRK